MQGAKSVRHATCMSAADRHDQGSQACAVRADATVAIGSLMNQQATAPRIRCCSIRGATWAGASNGSLSRMASSPPQFIRRTCRVLESTTAATGTSESTICVRVHMDAVLGRRDEHRQLCNKTVDGPYKTHSPADKVACACCHWSVSYAAVTRCARSCICPQPAPAPRPAPPRSRPDQRRPRLAPGRARCSRCALRPAGR